MVLHAFTHLFNISLFDLPPSLFVASTDLCVKGKDSKVIVCYCQHHFSTDTKAQKCPHCGNLILEIEDALCLMAPLVAVTADTFLQTLYFFTIQSRNTRDTLMLDRVATVCFDAYTHHIVYKEFNAINEIESFEIDLLSIRFLGQSNTFSYLQKGVMPLGNDFGKNWDFDRPFALRKRPHLFPIHVQLSLEWILWKHHERFCPKKLDSISIFMIYYAYLFWCNQPYLNTLPIPFLHSKSIEFYEHYERYTCLNTLIEGALFQHKATKAIKRWFYKIFKETWEDGKFFKVDLICILVTLFNDPNYLLRALKIGQTLKPSMYENIVMGVDLFKYLADQKGEKWLIEHMFDDGFYNDDFYDLSTVFSLSKDEFHTFVLPKIHSIADIVEAFALFLEGKRIMQLCLSKEPFNYSAIALSFEDNYKGFTFKLPHSPYELCMWAQNQNNCLDSYVEKVTQNKIIILGVFKAQKHCITLKLSASGEFIYAEGKNNQTISENDLEIVLTYCSHKIIHYIS